MTLSVITFGCRLNAYESEQMKARAEEAALADAILVNTCAVTAEAVRQARQAIRKARREHPERRIVVTGCAAQTEPETFAAMPEVDLVLGNAEKLSADSYRHLDWPAAEAEDDRLRRSTNLPHAEVLHSAPSRLASLAPQDEGGMEPRSTHREAPRPYSALAIPPHEKIRVNDIFALRETAPQMLDGFDGRVRAFVQVQNGCDHRCTFCVIPYGRGDSRSVPAGAVVEQIRRLVENGCREVVLTGVDITAWGGDLPGRPRLGKLVRAILRHVPELPRLRLSSIDSVEADPDLMRALAEEARLMPHLHLSLQAGDDMILKRMKRRHLRADAVRFCAGARRLRSDIVFGADLIAGFPTETETMFQNTLGLVEDCGLTYLHVFPFSPRAGTPAARMPQLSRQLVQQRARTVRQQGHSALEAFLSSEVGKVRNILVEKPGFGRTEHYAPVAVGSGYPGEIVSARIFGVAANRLSGQALPEAA